MEKLKSIRKSLGKSQVDMALMFKVSLTTWQMWEKGVTTPNEENMAKLNELLRGE